MKTISIYDSLLVLGRGIGQVMFQNNALSGLLMLVGIFLNSWQLGVLAVGGNIISTLAACISGYGRDDIKNGLYGFNGTLIGIAVGVFMQLSLWSLLLMAVASCFSTWIVRLFSRQHSLPGFTAPFIFSVWILLGICTWITPDLLLVSKRYLILCGRLITFRLLFRYWSGHVSRKFIDRTVLFGWYWG